MLSAIADHLLGQQQSGEKKTLLLRVVATELAEHLQRELHQIAHIRGLIDSLAQERDLAMNNFRPAWAVQRFRRELQRLVELERRSQSRLRELKIPESLLSMDDVAIKTRLQRLDAMSHWHLREFEKAIYLARRADPTLVDEFLGTGFLFTPETDFNRTRQQELEYRRVSTNIIRAIDDIPVNEEVLVDLCLSSFSRFEPIEVEDVEAIFGKTDQISPPRFNAIIHALYEHRANRLDDKTVFARAPGIRAEPYVDVLNAILEQSEWANQWLEEREVKTWKSHLALARFWVSGVLLCKSKNLAKYKTDIEKAIPKGDIDAQEGEWKELITRHFQQAAQGLGESVDTNTHEDGIRLFQFWFDAAFREISTTLPTVTDIEIDDAEFEPIKKSLALINTSSQAYGDELVRGLQSYFEQELMKLDKLYSKEHSRIKFCNAVQILLGKVEPFHPLQEWYEHVQRNVKFVSVLDGSPKVGLEPFGVKLFLESDEENAALIGGLSKYLENRQTATRDEKTTDYRDFAEIRIRDVLSDKFDVHAIRFAPPDTKPKESEPGKFRLLFGYLICQARERATPVFPRLRIDIDFPDLELVKLAENSNQDMSKARVALSVSSNTIEIDTSEHYERPGTFLNVKQLLAYGPAIGDQDKLRLTVSADGDGCIPRNLNQVLDFDTTYVDSEALTASTYYVEFTDDTATSSAKWAVLFPKDYAQEGYFYYPVPLESTREIDVTHKYHTPDDSVPATSGRAMVDPSKARESRFWKLFFTGVLGISIAVWLVRKMLAPPSKGHSISPEKKIDLSETPDALLAAYCDDASSQRTCAESVRSFVSTYEEWLKLSYSSNADEEASNRIREKLVELLVQLNPDKYEIEAS